jgi:transcriptional regulator with XRE-family HTH domain
MGTLKGWNDLLASRRRSLPSPSVRRELREAAGLSQADIAAALGVSPAAVSRWEAGKRAPRGPWADLYRELLQSLVRIDG